MPYLVAFESHDSFAAFESVKLFSHGCDNYKESLVSARDEQ